jgi:SAM-dependent methyltransferase
MPLGPDKRSYVLPPRGAMRVLYGSTILLSAFLAFQVQPLIAKLILPWFGGAAAVWTTCLVFFQAVLLLAYAYAHGLIRWVRAGYQSCVHLVVVAASLLFLPIIPDPALKGPALEEPAFRVLMLLALTVGLPYFVLTSASPLLQAWYAGDHESCRVYRFYALSNAGSLLAVLSYPVLFEPFFSTRLQAMGWSVTYGLACILSAAVALARRRMHPWPAVSEEPPPPAWSVRALWLALPACASTLLLAITHHLSQNLAAIPLLWVIPLTLYLLSFVLTFAGPHWYRRNLILRLLAVALGAMAYALQPQFASASLILLVPLFCAGLFICCMACHGELARLKPPPRYLTSFYLTLSVGGTLGGTFVALIAPRVFSGYFELPLALGSCAVLTLVVLRRDPESPFYKARWQPAWLLVVLLAVGINLSLLASVYREISASTVMVRNFFGTLREADVDYTPPKSGRSLPAEPGKAPRRRQLINGPIQHGLQLLSEDRRREPTAYYGPNSGVGLTIQLVARQGPLRVGIIGLGVGTVAAYGRAGDHYVFYEINPQVIELANRDFTFLRDSAAEMEILVGDARLSLEGQGPQSFDVLAVDAFSGDAIPVHLLTREAFELYVQHLKPGGVLAVHISNSYLNLQPVVERAAVELGKPAVIVRNDDDEANGILRSTWVLVSDRRDFLESEEVRRVGIPLARTSDFPLWTDDYSNLIGILKWVLGS